MVGGVEKRPKVGVVVVGISKLGSRRDARIMGGLIREAKLTRQTPGQAPKSLAVLAVETPRPSPAGIHLTENIRVVDGRK